MAQSGQYFGPPSLLFRIENLMLGTEVGKLVVPTPPSQSLQALKDLCFPLPSHPFSQPQDCTCRPAIPLDVSSDASLASCLH